YRLPLVEVGDLRVRVELIEKRLDAAGLGDRLIERLDALVGRELLRLVQEVAQPGPVRLRLDGLLSSRDALGDARPVALLEAALAVDVRLRALQAEAVDRRGLREHRRGAEDPGVDRVALPRRRGLLMQRVELIERAGVLLRLRR